MSVEFPIDLLRTFAAVTEHHSFTKAGEALHITQSAVSMQMKRLEQAAGQSLFKKEGRSFSLTVAGETMLEHARRILEAHGEAVAAFTRPNLMGQVRFGCAEDFASTSLYRVLSGFRREYPRIRVDIQSAPILQLRDELRRGELDLCLLEGVEDGGAVVHHEPVVWATARRGAAHRQDPLPLAVYHQGCIYRQWALDALRDHGRPYWISFVSPSISSILAAVRAGLAVAPIGAGNLDDSLMALGPENGFPLLPVSEFRLWRSDSADDLPVDCFAQYVADSFRDQNNMNPTVR